MGKLLTIRSLKYSAVVLNPPAPRENFPLASWLLPKPIRVAVRHLYAFARTADDLADEGEASAERRLHWLDAYERALIAVVSTLDPKDTGPWHSPLLGIAPEGRSAASTRQVDMPPAPGQAAWPALFEHLHLTLTHHRLPVQPLFDLLSAFRQDVHNPVYERWEDLLDYGRRSTAPAGRLILHLHGLHDEPALRQSDALCQAVQLTNCWQDLSVDIARQRIYVPLDLIRAQGLGLQTWLRQATRQPPWPGPHQIGREVMVELVQRTRDLLLQGAPLARRLPGRSAWELRLIVSVCLRVLQKLQDQGFVCAVAKAPLTLSDKFWALRYAIQYPCDN